MLSEFVRLIDMNNGKSSREKIEIKVQYIIWLS